ncbi:protein phosphatase regulator [Coemansia sp. RSA 2320]|nr:protein phosphatase regulator [Coemansia sp. RSA 2320]
MNFQGLEFDGVPTDSDVASDDNESVSSLIDEDVDPAHVYALFHFPQMVDGQVTVLEGEKLTLLDDSNSYWWLVQNLRDNQMGYIPADNIETAQGKLARVNRRKNLKLCKPDPEHILNGRIPTAPDPTKRRVKFNDKLVTQVFISSPVSDADDDEEEEEEEDDDEEEGGGYDEYDYDDGEDEDHAVVPDEGVASRQHAGQAGSGVAGRLHSGQAGSGVAGRLHSGQAGSGVVAEPEADDDSDDYSYYYSSSAGNSAAYMSQQHEAAEEGSARAAEPHQHQGAGPGSGSGSDSNDGRPMHSRLVGDASMYYLSNEDSDEGDSLTGAAGGVGGSGSARESVEAAGRFTLRIFHVDAAGATAEDHVTVFLDELFGEVLRRALALFGQAAASAATLHAQVLQGDMVALTSDTQVGSLFDHLRSLGDARLPDAGDVAPELCALVLSGQPEDDPYLALAAGSRSVLRTSIAASVSEGISALAAAPVRAGSASPPASPSEPSEPSDPGLPDSRRAVQTLLRNIPPPKSRPSLTALSRAKRNTLQLSPSDSAAPADLHPPITRSLSQSHAHETATLGRSQSSQSSREHTAASSALLRPQLHDIATRSLAPAAAAPLAQPRALSFPPHAAPPADPASSSHALGQSASTLRPSSDTFTEDTAAHAPLLSAHADAHDDYDELPVPASSATIGAEDLDPVSPTETASLAGSSPEISARPAAAAAAALSASASHRSLKDVASSASSSSDHFADELSLDDWLVILRGWNDSSDIAAASNTSSFYHSFLRDLQNLSPPPPNAPNPSPPLHDDTVVYIYHQIAELQSATSEAQSAIDDILGVSQGVGRRLDSLERELDEIARVMVQAN